MGSMQPHPTRAYPMHNAPGQPATTSSFGINSSVAVDDRFNMAMMNHQQAAVATMNHQRQQCLLQQQQQAQYSPGLYGCYTVPRMDPASTCRAQYSQTYNSPSAQAALTSCSPATAGFPNTNMRYTAQLPVPGGPMQCTAHQQWQLQQQQRQQQYRLPTGPQNQWLQSRRLQLQQQQQQQPPGLGPSGGAAAAHAMPFPTLHAHVADVWQHIEQGATTAGHAAAMSLAMSAGTQSQAFELTNSQQQPLVLHNEQQQQLLRLLLQQQQQQQQQQQERGMRTAVTAVLSAQRHFAASHSMGPQAASGLQVVHRPACKRKPAVTLQTDRASRPVYKRQHAAVLQGDPTNEPAAATAAADFKPVSDSPAAAAAPCGHSPALTQCDVAALLGAGSSDQAAAQLHNMIRQQLFAFAAQMLAGSPGYATPERCSSETDGATSGSAGSAASPIALPKSRLYSSAKRCISCCAAQDAAARSVSPNTEDSIDALLPAMQLEAFYSKPMSPAEAAAEAAAVAKAIVAVAKAAAVERVHSSRSNSPASPEPSELHDSSDGVTDGLGVTTTESGWGSPVAADSALRPSLDAAQGTLIMPLVMTQAADQPFGPEGTGSPCGSLKLQLGPTAATTDTPKQQQPAVCGSALGASGSTYADPTVGLQPLLMCGQDPAVAALEDSLELGCTPSSSQTGHGFESSLGLDPASLGLGLVQDDGFGWQEESPAAWGLSDLSDLPGFDQPARG